MVFNNAVSLCFPPRWSKMGTKLDGDSRPRVCGLTSTQIMLSIGSDIDIATDWIYYESLKNNEDIPKILITLEYICCIFATIVWLMQVLEGRIFKRVAKVFGFDLTKKQILEWGLWIEDIPQILMSATIMFLYDFSYQGLVNVAISVYDGYQKFVALRDGDFEEEEEYEEVPEEITV
uniref:Uncharacterized protein n=1 Tax=Grammatophora oceanica TaxID=210454 RepID=A0A7S1YEE6_9STRA|mmetsp:Transcript_42311/g.62778  ORF Transcript_42311/g.62778 Transcript_42311/m.62778 type:complete len:177 (+) Transcript_42311:84-614(+)|eukprot:CAMPEP_0194034224 /NCGR_PEP_ID=MMETSP0009_2-20130614/6629_1 /TAXON_ID=210454 /ORGANISM="Grammatophora oceanica, Strain CCMP 410" /LENGTH=176 /DNA_ID=CAMNT_0038675039 /DNA_START=53 /DNA_END=583 /DNA_ORIENTATION=+